MPIMTNQASVWVPNSVLNFFFSEATAAVPNETGGILLGYVAQSSRDAVVTHAIGAGPEAVHEPDYFAPDYNYQEAEIARIYEASNRLISYLGDWHSHPIGSGRLSRTDRRTFRAIAACETARAPEPFMLILANSPDWVPVAWRGRIVRNFFRLPRFVTWQVSVKVFVEDPP